MEAKETGESGKTAEIGKTEGGKGGSEGEREGGSGAQGGGVDANTVNIDPALPSEVTCSPDQCCHISKVAETVGNNAETLARSASEGQMMAEARDASSVVLSAVEAPADAPVASSPQGLSNRRAVTVGINYVGLKGFALAGCVNDSDAFVQLLRSQFGVQEDDIRQLCDDVAYSHCTRMWPTRANIIAELEWLVKDARAGDELFFHYSGHGSQQKDTDGDEKDGMDETIVPCDFSEPGGGMISDDDLRRVAVLPLCKGARLTIVMDCCHSGTGIDLPYMVRLCSADGGTNDGVVISRARSLPELQSSGHVVMFSGCNDDQTSADVKPGSGGKASGAMTAALMRVVAEDPDVSYRDLLAGMRKFLTDEGFSQIPQLTCEHVVDLSEPFMPAAANRVARRRATLAPPLQHSRKALVIGIQAGPSSSSSTDAASAVADALKDTFRFNPDDVTLLSDCSSSASSAPNRASILGALNRLAAGSKPGDERFLCVCCGPGSTFPSDAEVSGPISSTKLRSALCAVLAEGSRLLMLLDGAPFDAPTLGLTYEARVAPDRTTASLTRSSSAGRGSLAAAFAAAGEELAAEVLAVAPRSGGSKPAPGSLALAFAREARPEKPLWELLAETGAELHSSCFARLGQRTGLGSPASEFPAGEDCEVAPETMVLTRDASGLFVPPRSPSASSESLTLDSSGSRLSGAQELSELAGERRKSARTTREFRLSQAGDLSVGCIANSATTVSTASRGTPAVASRGGQRELAQGPKERVPRRRDRTKQKAAAIERNAADRSSGCASDTVTAEGSPATSAPTTPRGGPEDPPSPRDSGSPPNIPGLAETRASGSGLSLADLWSPVARATALHLLPQQLLRPAIVEEEDDEDEGMSSDGGPAARHSISSSKRPSPGSLHEEARVAAAAASSASSPDASPPTSARGLRDGRPADDENEVLAGLPEAGFHTRGRPRLTSSTRGGATQPWPDAPVDILG